MPIKLNLGAGNRHFDPADGWINVDLDKNLYRVKPDVAADARHLPFPDKYADEIHAIHLLEHFYIWEAPNVLTEWNRVLKDGGMLYIELPDLTKIVDLLQKNLGLQKTWAGLYGDPTIEDPTMVHKWCYTFEMLKQMLEFVGFGDVEKEKPLFHVPMRDMRLVARKKEHCKDAVAFVKEPTKEMLENVT